MPDTTEPTTLTVDQIRADVADVLGEDVEDIPVDENLVDYGLDSMRIMTLVERWRRDHGITATFVDLAEQPAIEAWAPLLGAAS
ncbi:phosphopantetheine-binding protein [Streptomyces sp. NBC_00237]|uniref:phosphopantetheine-binding protein n=1 Tax=Streptomyces sp. NBC_00237 TaxID=2975687 RepID=UPI00224C8CAC|nr:phosphopantetheine-binding protein [Streptomyces sp. NBC_00237]MCX5202986.1 phosphopantetheine-binding protein [Streptomyces sp. NBC_00237]